jgi:hypothetical protein
MAAKKKGQSKSSRLTKQSSKHISKQDTCFVIMPFGEWFDHYYETIYIPAIEAVGLKPRRADDLYRPSSIVNDIWALTQKAKVILADLSGKNPNVFYELGLAHAVTKPAILVTESIEDIPFDLRALRVIVYDKNEPEWGTVLKGKIETAIKEILESPLEAVLPTFLKVKESTPEKTVTKAEKELISMKQDIDLLKRELQARLEPPQKIGRPYTTFKDIDYVKELIERGATDDIVVRRLIGRGVDSDLARHVVNDIRRRLERESKAETVPETSEPEEAAK